MISRQDDAIPDCEADHDALQELFPKNASDPVPARPGARGSGARRRQHSRRRRQKRRVRQTLFLSGVLLGLPVLAVALLAILLPTVIAPINHFADNPFPTDREKFAATDGSVNLLLIGSDTRDMAVGDVTSGKPTGQRSDTLMLVHIPADRKYVAVVSLMRDLYVPIPDHGTTKLNAAFSYGGVPLTVRTVEQLLQIPINHVAVMSFQGFSDMSEAVGGVPVQSPKAFDSRNLPGYHFTSGRNVISGDRALAFVRERYAFSNADFQRVANQQSFLNGLLQVASTEYTHPLRLIALARAVTRHATTDSGLSAGTAASLAWSVRHVRTASFAFLTAPTAGTSNVDGQSVVNVDASRLAKLKKALRDDTPITSALGGDVASRAADLR